MADYNPRALKPDEVANALKAAGSRSITAETVAADLEAGAPANADVTVDIFKYAAWILKELNRHGG